MNNPLIPLLTPLITPEFDRIEEYVAHYATITPHAEACVEGARRLTYRQLADEVDRCAAALVRMGIRPLTFVATHAPPSIDYFVTYLATLKCGATWVGLNPKYQSAEIDYVLQDAQPTIVFMRLAIGERQYADDFLRLQADSDFEFKLVGLDGEDGTIESYADFVMGEGKTAVSHPASVADALLVYTSGSTGKPKGGLLSHNALIRAARIRHAVWHRAPMRCLLNVPINHIGGAGDISCTALIGGGTLIFVEKFDPLDTLKIIETEKLTFLYQTPSMLQMTFFLPEVEQHNLSSLQAVVWSGARASQSLIERLTSLFVGKLGTDYSMTESVGAVTMTPLTDDLAVLGNSVGWPIPERNVTIDLETDEILVCDDYMMSGYYKREKETAVTIDDQNRLHTGDKGKLAANGTLTLTGRMSSMFKSGGYNVYPVEVEAVIERYDGVETAVVVSAPDPLWGETGHAFLTVADSQAADVGAIEQYCRTQLANYKIPKSFTIIEQMPKLPIGKIDRKALQARL